MLKVNTRLNKYYTYGIVLCKLYICLSQPMISQTKKQPQAHTPTRHRLGAFLANSESLAQPNDFASLVSVELVVPFFLHRLREEGVELQDFPELQSLILEARHYTAQYMLQEHAMLEVNKALIEAGIKPIWLKGAALAHTIYPQPTLRTKADLDIIVPTEDFQQALRILNEMNYHDPNKGLKTVAIDKLSHHAHLRHKKFYSVILELHHRLLGHSGRNHLPSDILAQWLNQTIEFQVNGQRCYTLKPELHFLYICAHVFLQHGEAALTLRDLLDLHLLALTYELDWEYLVDQSVQLEWTYLLKQALNRLKEYLLTPLPQKVFDTLDIQKSSNTDIENVVILKSSGDIRGEGVLQLLKQLTLLERVQAIWQIAVPPHHYMRERYDIPSNRSTLPYYFYRWFDQLRGLITAFCRRLLIRLRKILR